MLTLNNVDPDHPIYLVIHDGVKEHPPFAYGGKSVFDGRKAFIRAMEIKCMWEASGFRVELTQDLPTSLSYLGAM